MSSPAPSAMNAMDSQTPPSFSSSGMVSTGSADSVCEGVSLRPMRVKVLYTFDDQNKTNCLARWPHVLNIQTAFLDETTQIGVIELKTCIQAIVAASPELVAKLGQDYTVYAYDYSEYETPLVGQGMLSWVLASASSTPSAPAHQSRTMITGRVCKNILGLFSSGIQETLEVKLRLVPVPTCLQSEYLNSMEKYRELSKLIPQGFDASAWTKFLQENPQVAQLASRPDFAGQISASAEKEGAGMEIVQQLLNQGMLSNAGADYPNSFELRPYERTGSFSTMDANSPSSRTATPAPILQASAALQQNIDKPSRPSSRASNTSMAGQRRPAAAVEASEAPVTEEGPVKKRARVTKADWHGKSSLGTNTDSLRVAASTAASIRVYRPVPKRPGLSDQTPSEGVPRAPTPRPFMSGDVPTRRETAPPSRLRRESIDDGSTYQSPYASQDFSHNAVGSPAFSPEDGPSGSSAPTPSNIASSPPLMQAISPVPSSPALPNLRSDFDSGFMSGPIDDLFEDRGDDIRPPHDDENEYGKYRGKSAGPTAAAAMAATTFPQPNSGFEIREVNPGPPELLPKKMLPRTFDTQRKRAIRAQSAMLSDSPAQSEDNASGPHRPKPANSIRPKPQPILPKVASTERSLSPSLPPQASHTMNRTASTGSLQFPLVAASDPVQPPPSSLQRSQTWAAPLVQYPASDAPTPMTSIEQAEIAKQRSGSGAKRKKAIQDRLATSIAAGEMPPYCENCGEIETPTWRKAWTKVYDGSPDHIKLSEEDGGVLACEALQRDGNGKTILYRIIKKSLLEEDSGFTEILLCNPCGLWMTKTKCMRPQSVWAKPKKDPGEKKKRPPKKRKPKGSTPAASDAPTQADNQALTTAAEGTPAADSQEEIQRDEAEDELKFPPAKRPRSSSMQIQTSTSLERSKMSEDAAVVALQRAIQSSPAGFLGSRQSPIELDDLTPKPTRRTLFQSPRKQGEVKVLQDKSLPNIIAQPVILPTEPTLMDPNNKENYPPKEDGAVLEGHIAPLRASTPPPSNHLVEKLLKTPSGSARSKSSYSPGMLDLPLQPKTPARSPSKTGELSLTEMTPFTRQLNQLLSEANFSPGRGLDFQGLLPPLENASPNRRFDNFSFDAQDMLSTDIHMPSSPPAFFLHEDESANTVQLWSDYNLPGSPSAMDIDSFLEGGSGVEGSSERGLTQDQGPNKLSLAHVPSSEHRQPALGADFTALIDEVAGGERQVPA